MQYTTEKMTMCIRSTVSRYCPPGNVLDGFRP